MPFWDTVGDLLTTDLFGTGVTTGEVGAFTGANLTPGGLLAQYGIVGQNVLRRQLGSGGVFGGQPKTEADTALAELQGQNAPLVATLLQMQQDRADPYEQSAAHPDPAHFQVAQERDAALVQTLSNFQGLQQMSQVLGALPNPGDFDNTEDYMTAYQTASTKALSFLTDAAAETTPEDDAFANIQRRSMELDLALKEEELGSAQRARQQEGIFNLPQMLPGKARMDVLATMLDTPGLREMFLPTVQEPAQSSLGKTAEFLSSFGGK